MPLAEGSYLPGSCNTSKYLETHLERLLIARLKVRALGSSFSVSLLLLAGSDAK